MMFLCSHVTTEWKDREKNKALQYPLATKFGKDNKTTFFQNKFFILILHRKLKQKLDDVFYAQL